MLNKTAILLPENVAKIIEKLENAGFEAYIVGGCVRDLKSSATPHDWDICTNALPEQIKETFANIKTIDTGIKHGTVTLVFENEQYEVTTYRIDGEYTDGRHPDDVRFTDNLKQDLARRDFTVNALAWNPKTGVIDYFNGQADLMNRKIKCVGIPDERFQEDALRMIRAIRFSISKGFHMSFETYGAIKRNAALIKSVSRERIHDELMKTFSAETDLRPYDQEIVLLMYLLELAIYGESDFDRIENIDGAILNEYYLGTGAETDTFVKLAFLIDMIKGDNAALVKELKFSNAEQKDILYTLGAGTDIIGWVMGYEPNCSELDEGNSDYHKRHRKEILLGLVKKAGFRNTYRGIVYAATFCAVRGFHESFEVCHSMLYDVCQYVKDTPIYPTQLAITGNDLIDAGVPEGKEIGLILDNILHLVWAEKLTNDKQDIMKYVREKVLNVI